jgi:hypothetical protein
VSFVSRATLAFYREAAHDACGEVVRSRIVAIAIVILTAAVGSAATGASGARTAPTADGKKRCKIVKKRVHGHIKRVRVCTKPKPAPPSLPSKVTVTLDSAHATTASISADSGATLTAGAATLTVPAGAVAQTTTVTMTPVSKLGGLKGRIAGAFEFKPDGLQLLKSVTLTIDVPSTSGLEAFTYTGNGTDFHLYPVKVEGGKATVDLIHFSGYGVGEGLPQPAVAKVRQFLTTVVKPAVAQAKGDSRYFAVAALRTWELLFEMAALPTDDFVDLYPDFQALQADLGVALRKLADDQHAKCVETHDIVGTAKETEYTVWLILPLLFIKSQPLADAVSYSRAQVAKCKSFELDFDSTITYDFGNLGQDVSHVRVLRLKLNADNNWTNEALLNYVSATFHPGDCGAPAVSTRSTAPFKAKILSSWDSNPPKISMDVSSGASFEILDWDCPPPAGHQHLETASWTGGFGLLHGGAQLTIDDWSYLGGSVLARKTYSRTMINISESTTFELRHTPE